MSACELVDVLVMVVVMGTERVWETHQSAQGASELGVRMLENPTVHARRGCGGAEVKMQREAVWLNMQSKKSGSGGRSGEKEQKEEVRKRRGRAGTQADGRLPRPRCGL